MVISTRPAPGTDPRPSIAIRNLSVAYPGGALALEDVGLDLRGARICGLLGQNGSGKSTLFKAIMGFVRPLAGTVRICDRDVSWAQRESAIAYVPQTEEVDWTFPVSVRDVVTMGRQGRMGFLRIPSAADRRIVGESLERVGMGAFAGRQIGELSGGQRKRVFIARALAQEARLILLDEPFTGVDRTTEAAIIDLLRGLRDDGRLLLVSTHDLQAVPDFCDDVVLLNRRLVAAGPVAEAFTEENLARAFGGPTPRASAPKSVLDRGAAPRFHAEVPAEGRPRSTQDIRASFEAALCSAPQDEEGGKRGSRSREGSPAVASSSLRVAAGA